MAYPHTFGPLLNVPFSYLDDNFANAAQVGANSDITSLNGITSWTTQQAPFSGTLTDAANIGWNGAVNGQVVQLTIAGNRAMAAPTNILQHAMYLMRITQDAVGTRTLTWDSAYKFGSSGAPSLTATPSKTDILSFLGGASNTLEFLGIRKDAV